jgi:ADP-ribose pyrophosphatase YjhB (NUDIX family)
MYKIYIAEVPVYLHNQPPIENIKMPSFFYNENKEELLDLIIKLENKDFEALGVYIWHPSLTLLCRDFFSHYKIHKAGGGVVFNKENQILAIRRMGYWDLPKGKEEAGETMGQTAVREVREETGVDEIRLEHFITETFHTYNNRKGKRCLKWSFWYQMYSEETTFTPQTEEDIEEVLWIGKEELLQQSPIYRNIIDILNTI